MTSKKVLAALSAACENCSQLKLASFLMATTALVSIAYFPAQAQTAYAAPTSPPPPAMQSTQTVGGEPPAPGSTPESAADVSSAIAGTSATQLPTVTVESMRMGSEGYITAEPSLYKLTAPMVDTPVSITSIPRQILDDKGATTMRDALRNVPGISLAAGEAGAQGDNLTIRGFSARSDFFLDGMRDFGSYYRDPFNLENIEVLKGPDSLLFGRGSTGGVINQVSKQPEAYTYNNATLAFGSDLTRRGTVDFNQSLGDGMAIRLNMMGQDGGVADRNAARNTRYGFAPEFAMGLGTPTRLTVDYFHQSENDVPDYGVPWFFASPAGVPRNNYYGFTGDSGDDYLRTDADILTGKFEHDFNRNFTFRDQLRFANYQRDARITEAQIPAGTLPTTPLSAITVTRHEIDAHSVETFLDNQSDLTSKFTTGDFKHTLVSGIELSHETSDPTRPTWTGVPGTNLLNPVDNVPFTGSETITSDVNAYANSADVYATDTMAISEQWDLIGGLRWDYVYSYYDQSIVPASQFTRTDRMLSWRAGVVYKPQENGSIYFAAGTSFNPSIEQLSLSAANANAPPEETTSYEIGTKWDLFNKQMSTSFALFRDEKTNARTPDPNNPLLNVLSGDQQVEGFEIGVNGHITEKWQVFAGYAFMTSTIIQSNNPNEQGNQVANAPKHTFNLWTTYDLPYKVQVGGGMNAVSARNASTTPNTTTHVLETAPGYITFDAMAKYPITDKVSLQLNVYNLLDKYYYDQIHPAHIVPGAGRSVLLTTSVSF